MSPIRRFHLLLAFSLALFASAQPCLVGYNLVASTPPTNGTYACGETVTFCLTITSWNTTNANWFHGVVATFGPGWDLASLTPGAAPAPCGTGGGTWGWYNSVQGTAGTAGGPQGPGFFYDLNNDGNAGNNFGDFCTGPWTFCWTISVLSGPACINGLGLGVSFNTFGDSETGSWGSSACTGDVIVPSTPAVIQSCAADAGTGGPLALCSTSPPADLFATLTGTPDPGGTWTNPSGAPHSGIVDPYVDVSGNYTYTVGTIVPPCSSSSVVAVSIAQQPDAGLDGSVTLCASDAPTALIGSLGGTPDAGGSWTGPAGASSGTFDPAVDVAGVYTYTVAAVAPCVNANATVTVVVNASPNAGGNGSLTLCSNGNPAVLYDQLTGAPSVGGTWTNSSGLATSGTYDPAVDAPDVFTYTVAGVAPCPNSTATVTVTENQLPDAGVNSNVALCNTAPASLLVSLLGGTPDPGGTWTDPSGAAIGATLDPASLPASGSYTYTVIGAAPCPNASAEVALTLNIQESAGSNATVNLCTASAPIDLFTSLGGSPSPLGTWNGPSGPIGNTTFTPGISSPGDYIYTVQSLAPCVVSSATVTVNVSAQPSAGVDAALALCSSDAAASLYPELGPTAQPGGTWTDPNGAANSGTFTPGVSPDGIYTYTIAAVVPCIGASATVDVSTTVAADPGNGLPLNLCETGPLTDLNASLSGTPDPGGTWTTPSGGGSTGTIDPSTAASGNYTYTIAANAPCPAASTAVNVTISTEPDAGTDGLAQLCSNTAAPYALINAIGGSPAVNGTWTAPDGSQHSGSFNVLTDPQGIYTYTVNAPPPCIAASSTVTMSVVQEANAGSGGSVALCENNAPVDPFTWLSGSPDAGGSWSAPGGGVIANIDPATAASGIYTYTVNGSAPCPNDQATLDITIDGLPNAGADNSIDLCADANATNLFLLLGGAQSGGSWTGPAGAATNMFQPAVNIPGNYTYSVDGIGACANEQDMATVEVSVFDLPLPAFSLDVSIGCVPLQVQFVNSDPAAAQIAVWSFGDGAMDSGIADAWHSYDAPGSYDVTLEITDANGCTGTFTITDAVTVSAGPDAAFYALPLRVSVNSPTTQVTHIPDEGIAYSWSIDTTTVDTSGVFAWTFDPATIGEHPICLTATDTLGCENVLCINVLVDDDLTIFVANAFTPNGDDDNDTFKPSIIGVQADWYEFMVFDRWGLLVFRTTDPGEAWNGGMDNAGEALPDDVYVWTLKAKDQFTPEKQELIGTVTLVK